MDKAPTDGTRCTGDCCRRFYLPFGPGELAYAYALAMGAVPHRLGAPGLLEDIETIYPMAEWLGMEKRGTNGEPIPEAVNWYRCRNLQPNGDCGIYEKRPKMCSEYPYGGACRYDGCTWTPARQALVPDVRVARLTEQLREMGAIAP